MPPVLFFLASDRLIKSLFGSMLLCFLRFTCYLLASPYLRLLLALCLPLLFLVLLIYFHLSVTITNQVRSMDDMYVHVVGLIKL